MPATARWFAQRGETGPWSTRLHAGGAMTHGVTRITSGALSVIRKPAPVHEIAGLRAAQAVRPAAAAIPELVEVGTDADGPWLVVPAYDGHPSPELPPDAVDSLARLHVHFTGRSGRHPQVPLVDVAWWRGLCTTWVLPAVAAHVARLPDDVVHRARALVAACLADPVPARTLARITPTLLHGDIHPGNVLTGGGASHLIDWGSSRFGTPVLDLLNMTRPGTPAFVAYLEGYAALAGAPLGADELDAGVRWARLQIPLQYLPWVFEHGDREAVESLLADAERALTALAP